MIYEQNEKRKMIFIYRSKRHPLNDSRLETGIYNNKPYKLEQVIAIIVIYKLLMFAR